MPRALQYANRVAIGGKFFVAVMIAHHELAGDRRERAGSGKQRLKTGGQYPDPGAENLRPSDMAEVLMSQLMGQNPAQLIVTGAAQ